MAFARSTIRNAKLLIATTLAFGMLTSVSQAYTQEQQQLCTGDAMRLCGAEIPDVDRVTACMIRQRASLSDGCKAVFRYVPPAATATPASYAPSAKPSKPLNITPHKRG
jgi:hypothetical protein